MSRKTVGRRGALSGSLAAVLVAAPGSGDRKGSVHAAPAYQAQNAAREDVSHSPFLVAFLAWLSTASDRLVLPVSVDMTVPSCSRLRVEGVHPAIQILFPQNRGITVNVEWEGVDWDQLVWLDAHEKPGPDGIGWINSSFRPEFQVVHPTHDALWRTDVFERLLTWINKDLAHATHLAMWEIADRATWARLVHDGKVLRSRWTIETNGGTPAHLVPVHGYQAHAVREASVSIAWLSTRSEYWPPHVSEHWPPPDFRPLPGVAYLQFGIGADGAGWLARLARSSWFAGLEPRAEDLAVSGGVSYGRWAMPDAWAAGTNVDAAAEAEAFFSSESLPKAWVAVVAVPREAGPDEQAAALGLVGALRARRDPGGRALGVMVTVDAPPSTEADAFVRALLDRGAFVVRGGAGPDTGAAGDLLHHFPLRALKESRLGRLVCVDLADYLHVWRPGRVADLHVVPLAGLDAVHALRGMLLAAEKNVRALTLGFHLDPDAPNQGLVEVDRFATTCCELLSTPDGDVVFTDMDRLDGVTGSVDLLVVYDSAEAGG